MTGVLPVVNEERRNLDFFQGDVGQRVSAPSRDAGGEYQAGNIATTVSRYGIARGNRPPARPDEINGCLPSSGEPRDDFLHVFGVVLAGPEAVEPIHPVRRRIANRHNVTCLGELLPSSD